MTLSRTLRPVFALVAASLITSCSGVEGEGRRFEDMARRVADIPVNGTPSAARQPVEIASSASRGLRPAFAVDPSHPGALTVEVMDPHDLWDARDGLRRPLAAAAPALEGAVREAAAVRADRPVDRPVRTPSKRPQAVIQLGAYSSAEAAQAAWREASAGPARAALRGLRPEFETVQLKGKTFVRLRVPAPADRAAALCRAVEVSDPWCLRGA